MRIRATFLIVWFASGLLPMGAGACPTEAGRHEAHSRSDARGHSHGVQNAGAHSHEGAESAGAPHDDGVASGLHRGALETPEGDLACCRIDTRAPAVPGAAPDSPPAAKLILAAIPTARLDLPRVVTLPSAARLRLTQPPPLPYTRSRRPLVI